MALYLETLLPAAIYTARFHPLYYKYSSPRDLKYKNPGESLLSLLVARHLRREVIELHDPHEQEVVEECLAFAGSAAICQEVYVRLMETSADLLFEIEAILTKHTGPIETLSPGDLKDSLILVRDIYDLINDDKVLEAYPAKLDTNIDPLDSELKRFRDKLYILQDKIRELRFMVVPKEFA